MKIALGCDHGGWKLKEIVRAYLEREGHDVRDFGTDSPDSCDYPDFALPVAEAVARGNADRGILICTTGIGMSIAANKVPGVRAALCKDEESARLSREHNDANVLTMGASMVGEGEARGILGVWLSSDFEGGRHDRRVGKIKQIEKKYAISS